MKSDSTSDYRFIPAGAGNTYPASSATRGRTVHPRRRGEHCLLMPGVMRRTGSSPQARGTLMHDVPADDGGRFIPAGAGNTNPGLLACRGGAVHPRRRGEHAKYLSSRITCSVHPRRRGEHAVLIGGRDYRIGSSPQARGTLDSVSLFEITTRFIPAGAGNTCIL